MTRRKTKDEWQLKREAELALRTSYNKELDAIIERVQKLNQDALTGKFKEVKAAGDERVRRELLRAGYALQTARSRYR